VGWEREVLRLLTVAIDDDGDLLVPAQAAGGPFAELGATLCGNDDLRHDMYSCSVLRGQGLEGVGSLASTASITGTSATDATV
jgi:hypothetical protein